SLATLGAPFKVYWRTYFVGGHMGKYGLIKLGLAAVMLTSASAASEGADVSGAPYLPPPAPIPFVYNWTGFYAGAHVGVGWSDDNAGLIGGGQVGFNYQINQWVLGIEGDLAGTTIKDSVSATVAAPWSRNHRER